MNSARNQWLMSAVGLGILLNPLSSSMISVAIARLQHVYTLDFTTVSWIVFCFYLASAVAQPVMGKASDMFGRRKIFLTGLIVSFAASLLAPLSPNFGWLLVSRTVQSIGTSMMVAVGMAIVRIEVKEKQAVALSVLSMFMSGAAAIGPFVGGVMLQWGDWPAIFIVCLPFAAVSFILSWRVLPKDAPAKAAGARSFRTWLQWMDAPGILLFTIGLISLLVGLLSAKTAGQFSWTSGSVCLLGIAALAVFVRHELRTASPFIPLRTFAQHPALTGVNVQYLLVNLLFYALFFGVPSYLQMVRHVSEFHTGLLMLAMGLSSLIASPIAGRWVDRSGPRPVLVVSAILMTLGSVWLALLKDSSPVISVCLALAAFGCSNGLNAVGLQSALFTSAPKAMIGVASGLFNTSRYVGTILSSLLTGLMMGGSFSFIGFRRLAMVLAVIGVALVFMSLRHREAKQHVQGSDA
ncbi:MFS transporter [Paenibacillus oryzisoli]|uniref:MFS transporter n=1 Tax=Paenibacillus oryzisoli TaxID=1850517 RepID=UPI003D29E3BC